MATMRTTTNTPTQSISNITLVDWSCHEESSDSSFFAVTLPRTHRLILDYKQFKAAQRIQRYVRGWLVRLHFEKFKLAAIVIQKWWRRYMAYGILMHMAESKVQLAVISHFDSSATLIQKVFRGWWCRKHVNNLTKLKSLQLCLAEYLFNTLGIYLHDVKRKGNVPGLYYEKIPERCNETIDQLLSSLDYRIFNAFSCYQMQRKLAEVADLRNDFKQSGQYTFVPFRGFDDCGCVSEMPGVEETHENVNLIRAYVCMKHDMDMKSNLKPILTLEEAHKSKKQVQDTKGPFLKRIALDMRKWHDVNGQLVLPRKVFRITDIKALLEEVKINIEDVYGRLEPCSCDM